MSAFRTSALVLLVLTALTVFGVVVIDSHSATALLGRELWIAVVLLAAFGKVGAIGYWFMELRTAPPRLRYLFFGWCAVFAAVLVALAWA
ncbi:cytochrome C oxidase subunit IV family protein [Nocardia harenae]|uniref:cytochrome C oxidase subunit IV family protein n=1 Tax=Nocardia harenae TaxID=358707 RepID=UPI0008340918|nr:cytochrome C oxidase subunit IV family protein [Nocardia harenae]